MTEKNVQTDNKVLKAGAGYVIGNYLLKGITFLSAPIFTRLLTKEEFGLFGTYTSYESILYIFIGLALHSSLNNAKYKYKEKFNEYVSFLITFTGICTFLWLLLANVFYDCYGSFFDFSRPVVNIMILHCFGTSMFQFFNVYVSLNYQVKSFLTMTSINAISNMVLSIALLLTVFYDSRLLGRIIGVATPEIIIGIFIVYYFYKKSKPAFKKNYFSYGLRYSIPIIPHGISQIVLSSFDRIMINEMIGSAQAGLYNFSYTVNSLVRVVASSLDNVWKPWLYEKMDKKDYDSIRKQGTKYALGMGLFTSLVVIATPEVIKILGAREYWDSVDCTIPVIVGGFFAFMYTLPVMIEYYYERTELIAVATIMAAVLNVVLNWFCIAEYGYIAAAYTTLITYFLYFLFHFIIAAKIHGKSLFSILQLFGICAGVLVIAAVTLLIQDYFVIRLILGLILAVISFIWADRSFNIVAVIKKKMG